MPSLSERNQTLLVVFAVVTAGVVLSCPWPVLDEESYLAIAGQFSMTRPYDWWRPWPPWLGGREADAFVYAHPPIHLLWVSALSLLPLPLTTLKAFSGLPWALMLAASALVIARKTCRRPGLALWVWLTAPITLLTLQRGLMPDLPVVAWSTAAVAGWLIGGRTAVLGGLCLGMAIWTKYPALLLAVVLAADGWKNQRQRRNFWMAALLIPTLGEIWLWVAYGRLHLWEVLSRAGEIPRGPLPGRIQGLLVRASLLAPLPVLLAAPNRMRRALAALAIAAVAWGWAGGPVGLLLWVWVGGLSVVLAMVTLWGNSQQDRPLFLLGFWVMAVFAGVGVGHNFAGARYLFPAALPTALLLVNQLEARQRGRWLLWTGGAVWLMLALVLTWAEHRLAEAQVALADTAIAHWPEGGQFQGEWTFRWRMEQAGWDFYTGSTDGRVVVSASHAAAGSPPPGERVERFTHGDAGPIIVAPEQQVGLYGETIGVWPFGWSDGPIEEVTAWR